MKFLEIKEGTKVFPGEYILHEPTRQIVLCGAFKGYEGIIKVLSNGKLMEDKVENFRKIQLNKNENQKRNLTRSCGGCKKK